MKRMKEIFEDVVCFVLSLPWMILMYTFIFIDKVKKPIYDVLGIKYRYGCEGFIERIKK